MEKVIPIANSIPLKQLPFRTLRRARKVYAHRMCRMGKVFCFSVLVVSALVIVVTFSLLSAILLIIFGCFYVIVNTYKINTYKALLRLQKSTTKPRRNFVNEASSQMSPVTHAYSPNKSATVSASRTVSASTYNTWLELEYNGEIQRLYLHKEQHQLGKDPSWADLKIPDAWSVVSGRHAVFRKDGEKYHVFDGDGQGRSSTNGLTTQSGDAVDMETGYLLEHGTQITIGRISGAHVTITFFDPANVRRIHAPMRVKQSKDGAS